MLSTERTRTLARAWLPSARGLPLPTLAGGAVLATAPTFVVVVRDDPSHSGALVAAALILGAMAGYAVEDPAEETLSASPTALARRRLLRLSALALGAAAVAVLLLLVAVARADVAGDELGRRLVELLAAAGLASAAAGSAQRRGVPGAGHGGAVAALVGVLLVAALAHRYTQLPSLVAGMHHERWWWVAIIGSVVTGWTWRDPMR